MATISSADLAGTGREPLVALRSPTGVALIAASGVTLTAAVLAAVGDADLGEASGINDASSRIGGVVVIALVPVLIGATGVRTRSPDAGCAIPIPAKTVKAVAS